MPQAATCRRRSQRRSAAREVVSIRLSPRRSSTADSSIKPAAATVISWILRRHDRHRDQRDSNHHESANARHRADYARSVGSVCRLRFATQARTSIERTARPMLYGSNRSCRSGRLASVQQFTVNVDRLSIYAFNREIVANQFARTVTNRCRSCGSPARVCIASARAAASRGGTNSAVSLWTAISRQPGTSLAIVGRAHAAASNSTLGKPSRYEGRHTMCAKRSTDGMSDRCPHHSTLPSNASVELLRG